MNKPSLKHIIPSNIPLINPFTNPFITNIPFIHPLIHSSLPYSIQFSRPSSDPSIVARFERMILSLTINKSSINHQEINHINPLWMIY